MLCTPHFNVELLAVIPFLSLPLFYGGTVALVGVFMLSLREPLGSRQSLSCLVGTCSRSALPSLIVSNGSVQPVHPALAGIFALRNVVRNASKCIQREIVAELKVFAMTEQPRRELIICRTCFPIRQLCYLLDRLYGEALHSDKVFARP